MPIRIRPFLTIALPLLLLGVLLLLVLHVESPLPQPAGNNVSTEAGWLPMNLEAAESVDRIPGWDVRRGNFQMSSLQGKKVLELLPEPMVEGKILWKRAMRGGGGVRVKTQGKRGPRAFPRFSVGLHQEREWHLRALPGLQKIELATCNPDLTDEQILVSAELPGWEWKPEDWIWLELQILPAAGADMICEGRLWKNGSARPDTAQLTWRATFPAGAFFAALQGAPFALRPIFIEAAETRVPPLED